MSNPYVWGENSATIGPLLMMSLEDSNGNEIEAAVDMSVNAVQPVAAKEANASIYSDDRTGMTFHKVNVTSAHSALLAQVDMEGDTIDVYFRHIFSPTLTDYDYTAVAHKTGDGKFDIVIPEAYIEVAGIYYIGLKIKEGEFHWV